MTLDQWADENDVESATATNEEMKQHIESVLPHEEEKELPWVEEEELFIVRPPILDTSVGKSRLQTAGESIAVLAVLLSMSIMILRSIASAETSKCTNINRIN